MQPLFQLVKNAFQPLLERVFVFLTVKDGNIILNFIFIPKYGYISAAYTTLAGYFAMLAFHYTIVRFKLHKNKIYNNSFFLCLLLSLMILQYLIAQLYSFKLERYVVFGVYLFVLILIILKNKTELKEIVNKIKRK